jgi:hypothetical protein
MFASQPYRQFAVLLAQYLDSLCWRRNHCVSTNMLFAVHRELCWIAHFVETQCLRLSPTGNFAVHRA